MKATPVEIQKALTILTDTPRRLTAACAGAEESRLRLQPDRKAWPVMDALAHLRSCADVWGASIESMLAGDEPILPDIHPRQWLKQTNYNEINFAESLQAFSRQREKLVQTLLALQFEDWSRGAQIGGRRHTIFTQARRMAKHEAEYCLQVEELLTDVTQSSHGDTESQRKNKGFSPCSPWLCGKGA